MVCGLFRGAALAIWRRSETPFVHGRMEFPNTSPQAVELNPCCSGQAHSNRPGTGPGDKSTKPGSIFTVPHSICGLSIQKRKCQVRQGCPKDSAQLAQTGVWILVSLGEYLRTHLKDHTRYDHGPEIHGGPRRVSLPFGEAQLAECLRVWVSDLWKWDAGIH